MDKPGERGISETGMLTQLTTDQEKFIEHLFTSHATTEPQQYSMMRIRVAAKIMARILYQECPDCSDRYIALNRLREVVMFANASIALKGFS
jgi:hypothetical protein